MLGFRLAKVLLRCPHICICHLLTTDCFLQFASLLLENITACSVTIDLTFEPLSLLLGECRVFDSLKIGKGRPPGGRLSLIQSGLSIMDCLFSDPLHLSRFKLCLCQSSFPALLFVSYFFEPLLQSLNPAVQFPPLYFRVCIVRYRLNLSFERRYLPFNHLDFTVCDLQFPREPAYVEPSIFKRQFGSLAFCPRLPQLGLRFRVTVAK